MQGRYLLYHPFRTNGREGNFPSSLDYLDMFAQCHQVAANYKSSQGNRAIETWRPVIFRTGQYQSIHQGAFDTIYICGHGRPGAQFIHDDGAERLDAAMLAKRLLVVDRLVSSQNIGRIKIKLWNCHSGTDIGHPLDPHFKPCFAMQFLAKLIEHLYPYLSVDQLRLPKVRGYKNTLGFGYPFAGEEVAPFYRKTANPENHTHLAARDYRRDIDLNEITAILEARAKGGLPYIRSIDYMAILDPDIDTNRFWGRTP